MRTTIIAAVAATVLLLTNTNAYAGEPTPTVTVEDRAGAPGEMLRQLEKVGQRPLGTLDRVMAVDTAGAKLTVEEVEKLADGGQVDGVKVLGVMKGGREVLETTLTDLSDGSYDGPKEVQPYSTVLIFASYVPEGREWCLTMCLASLRPLSECIAMSRR